MRFAVLLAPWIPRMPSGKHKTKERERERDRRAKKHRGQTGGHAHWTERALDRGEKGEEGYN